MFHYDVTLTLVRCLGNDILFCIVCVYVCMCVWFELVLFRDSVRVDGTGAASIMEVSFQEVPVTEEQDNQSELKVLLFFKFFL